MLKQMTVQRGVEDLDVGSAPFDLVLGEPNETKS